MKQSKIKRAKIYIRDNQKQLINSRKINHKDICQKGRVCVWYKWKRAYFSRLRAT